jgi:hypothetical protein
MSLPRKKKRFEDSFTRFTTYLENQLHTYVHDLRQQGYVESGTALVNTYLRSHSPQSK